MKTINALAFATVVALATPQIASAQSTKTVTFARGATTATVTNVVTGYNTINYRVTAKQGQAMTVQMISSSPDIRFSVYAPGAVVGSHAPMFESRKGVTTYTGVLPVSGTYTIHTNIAPEINRRGVVAPFRLRITIPPAVTTPAPDDGGHGPDRWQVTGIDGLLNVRSGPGTSYGVVGRVSGGSIVRNDGCNGTGSARWCKINSNGISGWVSGTYLREYSGGGSTTPTPPPSTTQKYFQIWNVTTSVNVRSGPGTSYSRVGSVSKGSIVSNQGCAGSWCKIQTLQGTGPIITGWVSVPYLREYDAR